MAEQDPLSSIEAQLQELQAALLASNPLSFEQAAAALRQAAAALAAAPVRDPERIQALARQLTQVRDQLARVLALTQQQAATLLPPLDPVTYGSAPSNAPRIYRAPG